MKSISKNRRAFHEYHIEDKFEAGIALRGSEVKTLPQFIAQSRRKLRDDP